MTSPDSHRAQRGGRYRSLSNFYLADARRIASREQDVGLWWRTGVYGPIHRAAWVRDTGELYVVRLGPAQDGAGEVEVLGRARDRNELEQALEGWRAVYRGPDSMTWLRHRAASLAQRELPRAMSRDLTDLALTGRRLQQAKARVVHMPALPHDRRPRDGQPHGPSGQRAKIEGRHRSADGRARATTPNETAVGLEPANAARRRVSARLLLAGALAAPAGALCLELVTG